jgi:hypothetical protein
LSLSWTSSKARTPGTGRLGTGRCGPACFLPAAPPLRFGSRQPLTRPPTTGTLPVLICELWGLEVFRGRVCTGKRVYASEGLLSRLVRRENKNRAAWEFYALTRRAETSNISA